MHEKCPYSVFSGPHFPALDQVRRDTSYLSVFNPNAVKYGPEKLRIRTRFYAVLFIKKVLSINNSRHCNIDCQDKKKSSRETNNKESYCKSLELNCCMVA